jgi:hypothetical protein
MSDKATSAPDPVIPLQVFDLQDPIVAAAIETRAAERALEMARTMQAPQVVATTKVEHTSIATYNPSLDEVTVQFRRFTLEGHTSYMMGQQAGFPSATADRLWRRGDVDVIHRHPAPVVAGRERSAPRRG